MAREKEAMVLRLMSQSFFGGRCGVCVGIEGEAGGGFSRWIWRVKDGSWEVVADKGRGVVEVYSEGYMLARRSSSACCLARLSVSVMVPIYQGFESYSCLLRMVATYMVDECLAC